MADFDYEEIDKAVSGAQASDQPITDTSSAGAPAMRRSSGRYMDMVRTTPVSRPTPTVAENPVEARQSEYTRPFAHADQFHASHESPKRESLNPPSYQAEPEQSVEEKPAEASSLKSTSEQPLEPTESPLVSPFLPDTKVEKRPLGGVTTAETVEPSESAEPTNPSSQPSQSPVAETEPTTKTEPSVETSPLVDTQTVVDTVETSTTLTQLDAESNLVQDLRPTVTDSYQQIVSKSAQGEKKKPGWMVALWFAFLVAIGVGAGILVYTYVLPLL